MEYYDTQNERMDIRTIRSTAKNLLRSLDLDKKTSLNVIRYELKTDNNSERIQRTVKFHNEKCDHIAWFMSTLYITAYKGEFGEKVSKELDEMQNRCYESKIQYEEY
jgi:hypothetical protein